MLKSVAWVDIFQPETINECFLPGVTKAELERQIQSGEVPSMLFCGPPGIGKTTVALAIAKELDLEYLLINASKDGGIDGVRTHIQQFVGSMSFNSKRKLVILDEADGISAASQQALRGVINEYADNASFILTANFRNKIIEPLISRLVEIKFLFDKSEKSALAVGLYKFLITRLEEAGTKYDKGAVQTFIKDRLNRGTDIRKMIIDAQVISNTGVFETGSLIRIEESRLEEILQLVRQKNFDEIRTWVGENSDITHAEVTRYIYDRVKDFAGPHKRPVIVSMLNEYQFKDAFVVDKEINTATLLSEIALTL